MKNVKDEVSEEEKKPQPTAKEFYDNLVKHKVRCPLSMILMVPPIVEEITPGGIIKPVETLGKEEQRVAGNQFHAVAGVADNIKDIEAGKDSVWLHNMHESPPRVVVGDMVYMLIQYHQIAAIKPYDNENK